jgi:hypothetical protein
MISTQTLTPDPSPKTGEGRIYWSLVFASSLLLTNTKFQYLLPPFPARRGDDAAKLRSGDGLVVTNMIERIFIYDPNHISLYRQD